MLPRRIVIISGLAILTTLTVSALEMVRPEAYRRLCGLYQDYANQTGRSTPVSPDLVFLKIDAASTNLDESDIDELFGVTDKASEEGKALAMMAKHFPWSRQVYAMVLKRLVDAGARVVAFDLTFPGQTDDDPVFRKALDHYAGHVVIGSNFVDGTLTRPTDTLIPQTSPIDNRIGFTNFWADEDDVVRRARYHATLDQIRGLPERPNSERLSSLAAIALTKAGFGDDVPADMDDHALRFTALPRQGFASHSLFEIFVPSYWQQNFQFGKFFRDKIVIVGAEGNWQHDEHPSPLGNMPGPELHLNAINAAIHHEFLRELSPIARIASCIAAGFVAIFLSLAFRLPWLRFAMTLGVSAAAVAAGGFCFNRLSIFLPMIAPVTALNATMLFGLVYDFTSELMEKARLRRTLERYVSRDVVHEMIDRPEEYGEKLGGVVRPAAILFSDIRSYSAVVARSTPQDLVIQLNEYFTAMVDCVFECGGTLDKFIGDAVMAVWGTLHSRGSQQDAISAVQAALLMQRKLVDLNATWRTRGWPELRVGMGVNYGDVVVGNIGSPQRMEFTAIGDTVNYSWRLQEMTKKYQTNVILSSSVAMLVADHFKLVPLGNESAGSAREAYQICESEPKMSVDPATSALPDRPTTVQASTGPVPTPAASTQANR
jgi:adenylate cyclase